MLPEPVLLNALRGEQNVAEVCRATGLSSAEFRRERDAYLRRRLPPARATWQAGVQAAVDIWRDEHFIPHVYATTTPDLFFGLGLAMAQDRLWQMDCFRRRGQGRLAEILGADYLPSDVTHRTLGLDRIVTAETAALAGPARATVDAFVAGINRAIEAAGADLPIEFHILDYQPEPWSVQDVIISLRAIWWLLSGRLVSLVAGEAAQLLPEGPLRDAYLTPEFAEERIVPSASTGRGRGSDDDATGSNNWAVGGSRSRSGPGVLGSDPHQPLALPTNRYECRLFGPEDDAVGATWVGSPGIVFGRNRRIAWGLTNSNASVRDLYVEELDPHDRQRYRDGSAWRTFAERSEDLIVRGRPAYRLTVQSTVRGPIVNHLLPTPATQDGPPLALRWVGQEHLDDLRAMQAVSRAQDWQQFRTALRDWSLPVYNWGYTDVDGHVGYQCAARIPLRGRTVAGYRQASNPRDAWSGVIPFADLPNRYDPPQGFIASANNAPAGDDYPYPLYGAYAAGVRAVRIRQVIEQSQEFDAAACAALQNDTLSVRAQWLVPLLLQRLADSEEPDIQQLCRCLANWNFRYDPDEVGPLFFELFFQRWRWRAAAERFPEPLLPLVQNQGSFAARLLAADDLPWFHSDKLVTLRDCARWAVAMAKERFGPTPAAWTWAAVHRVHLRHPLSNAAVADCFDVGPRGVAGALGTVRSTGLGSAPLFAADSGAEYRLVADLNMATGVLATQSLGQSGQPGSPFYADQFEDWVTGRYHLIAFEQESVVAASSGHIRIVPSRDVKDQPPGA